MAGGAVFLQVCACDGAFSDHRSPARKAFFFLRTLIRLLEFRPPLPEARLNFARGFPHQQKIVGRPEARMGHGTERSFALPTGG